MGYLFNAPPGWPTPPSDWRPPKNWTKPSEWPDPPPGWNFWLETDEITVDGVPPPPDANERSTGRFGAEEPLKPRGRGAGFWAIIGGLAGVGALVVGWFAWMNPDPVNRPSSPEERAAYVSSVDQLCLDATATLTSIPADADDLSTYAQTIDTHAQVLDEMLISWAEFELPVRADETLVRPALDSLESMVRSLAEVASWARSGEREMAGEEWERLSAHSEQFRRHARAYGISECGGLAY